MTTSIQFFNFAIQFVVDLQLRNFVFPIDTLISEKILLNTLFTKEITHHQSCKFGYRYKNLFANPVTFTTSLTSSSISHVNGRPNVEV